MPIPAPRRSLSLALLFCVACSSHPEATAESDQALGASGDDCVGESADDQDDCETSKVFDVPSQKFPTIQSALDALPSGSTVHVAPGTYVESLTVDGKVIRIVGAGQSGKRRTLLKAANDKVAALAFVNGGGGGVARLAIDGGLYGIEGRPTLNPDGLVSVVPSPMIVNRVAITSSSRGVYGSFSDLGIARVAISGTAWNGISATMGGDLTVDTTVVKNAGGVGILVIGASTGAGRVNVFGVSLHDNVNGGLEIDAHGQPASVRQSFFLNNGRIGVMLAGVGPTTVDSIEANNTSTAGALYGDGIEVVQCTGRIAITGALVYDNARVGIANFASSVDLDNVRVRAGDGLPLDGETVGQQSYSYSLNPNNVTCDVGLGPAPCQVLSSAPQPPQPLRP